MRKMWSVALVLAGAFLFAPVASAQFTTVTATVKDPNGIPYAGAILNAVLVPSVGGGYTLSGQPYSGRIGPVTLDVTGSFTVNFGDVTLITPGSPQWQITIDSAAATINPSLGTGPQSFTFTSTGTTISGSSPVSLTASLNALAPKLTNFAGAGTGTIAGTITATHIPYASAANTLSDIAGSAVTGATGAIALTAGADTTKPLAINSHSTTQSATLLDVNNQATASADTPLVVRGRGTGSFTPGAGTALVHIAQESQATGFYGWILTNHAADVAKGTANLTALTGYVLDSGSPQICGGDGPNDGGNNYGCFTWGNPLSTGGETIVAQTACSNCVTNIVPFAVQGEVSQSVDLFDLQNSSAVVLSGFDQNGSLYFNGSSSGSAKIGVAAAAGTPCTILFPTTSPTVGQVLSSAAPSGGTCQTSWSAAGGAPAFSAITSGTNTAAAMVVGTGASLTTSGTGTIATTTQFTDSAAGAASTGALTLSGALFTGGSGTTTFPLFYRNCAGASAVTTWSTSGTTFGANECSGFAGNFFDFHTNGGGSASSLTSGGLLTATNITATSVMSASTRFQFTGNSTILSPTNGTVELTNNAQTAFTRLDLGGTTSSFPGIQVNGTSIQAELADGSAQTGWSAATYSTATNCSSSAAPAVCGSAAAGSVVIAATATTVTVNTTAVTANSQIDVGTDDTLGTKLSVTCNSTLATLIGGLAITARTAGTSFQITSGATPAVNPLCISYHITN